MFLQSYFFFLCLLFCSSHLLQLIPHVLVYVCVFTVQMKEVICECVLVLTRSGGSFALFAAAASGKHTKGVMDNEIWRKKPLNWDSLVLIIWTDW